MPSPNGYFDFGAVSMIDRGWWRQILTHDTNSPPWNTPVAGSYLFQVNIGTSAVGPFATATLTAAGVECSPAVNPRSPGGVTVTTFGVGGFGVLNPDTDYWLEVILYDDTATEVDRYVSPSPVHTEPYPTFAVLNPGQTTTTGDVLLGGTSGAVNQTTPCNVDTVLWEFSTTPGGPYTAEPIEDATSSPSHTFTGLTPNTTYYWRAHLFDEADVEYYVSPESQFTTDALPLNPACSVPGPVTSTTAPVAGTADNVPTDHTLLLALGTVSGGPYATLSPAVPGTNTAGQATAYTFSGLTASTQYFFRTEVRDAGNAVVDSSTECTFTTPAVVVPPGPPAFEPQPCGTGGAGGPEMDVEGTLVCDVDAAGNVVGTALVEAVYDETTGARTGTRLVNIIDGTPYVAQGTVQPCQEGCCPEPVVLCDVQPDNSVVTFLRTYTGQADGGVTATDQLLDGSVYVPTGVVGTCDPYTTCTPSPNIDLGADCGPGESPDLQLIADDAGTAPNSTVNDDPSADPLCGGQWARAAQPENAPFPVNETFRNATFDQAPAVTQGTAPYFQLTAPSIDPVGQGWGRGSDINSFTNGMWQVPNPFPASPGATVEITLAMHDGTSSGGDGWVFAFTNGAVPPQSTPIGGGGSLGLANWQGGYVGIVLDEYGGTGAGGNAISIQGIGALQGNIVATSSVSPHTLNLTTRTQPLRLRTSIITQFGQSYVSASIDWNDGNGFVQYFDRVNVTPMLGPAPATLRMGTNASSGGAYRDLKEQRDAVAHAAGIEQWRAFPITTDPIPACVTLVTIRTCVDLTFTSDTQTVGNSEPDAWLWLVNTATSAVIARTSRTSTPNQTGVAHNICVQADVAPADIPNLRVYVGADTRDSSGAYSTLWENFTVTASGAGCPATPVRTLAISAPCPLPVTIVGGSADGGGGGTTIFNAPSTFEDAPACLVIAGVTVPGFRREVRAADGSTDVKFLGEDGITVTPDSWTPGGCSARDTELIELCDVQPGGAVVAFLRVFTYDENGEVTSVENQDANGDPYTPTGTTTVCTLIDTESYILCDQGNANHQFLHYIVRAGGALAALVNTELDGFTAYAPVGPTGVCDRNVDQEVVCWTQTSTGATIHTGTMRHDDSLTGPITPGWALFDQHQTFVPATEPGLLFVPCEPETAAQAEILCDSGNGGHQFIRWYEESAVPGGVIAPRDLELDGTTAYAPVGPVVICTPTPDPSQPFGATEEVMCDTGADPRVSFIRRTTLTSEGAVLAVTTTLADGTVYLPVGPLEFGECNECCPVVVGTGCADEGSGVFTTSSIRLNDGTIQVLSQGDGHLVNPNDVVICSDPVTVTSSQSRLLAAAQTWTPADITGALTALGFTVLTGTADLADSNGTVAAGLPVGTSITWSAEDRNTLVPPQSILANAASTVVVWWTER